jgi:hypothetical protein
MKSGSAFQGDLIPVIAFRLRALVLALGETANPAWWKTEFMNETGLRFLERLYPRTYIQAAIHAAGKAAEDAHDKAVGRIGVYHLFRPPESLETELIRMSPDPDDEFIVSFRTALGQPEKLIGLLTLLCDGTVIDTAPGAKRIGSEKDIMTVAGLKKAAAVYHLAFIHKKTGFPYFSTEQTGGRG